MSWILLAIEYPLTTIGFTLTTCYFAYYFSCVVKQPLLASRKSAWRDFLLKNVTLLQERYWPTPWCVDGRLQTIFALLLRTKLPRIHYERETLTLKDGGILSLDWASKPKRKDQPILLILPGLTGSSQSEYIKGYVYTIRNQDICTVVFNHRGMANTELKTSRTYCGANSDDFEEALEHIHSRYPEAPIVATGISLGGMVLGNYLVTRGDQASRYLVAALVVSIPWNLFVATESLEKPICNLLINQSLTRNLRKLFHSFRHQLDGDYPWNYDYLMKAKTIREFDNRFTALNFGYSDVEEYYRAACLDDKLHKIRVPFLCLTSADDPFQPMEGIPVDKAGRSSYVALAVTSRGGHVGFLEGLFPYMTYYSDRLFGQYLESVFSNLEKIKEIKKEGDQFVNVST